MRNRRRGGPVTCFECGEPNHIRSNCPKLKGKEEKKSWRRPQARDAKAKKPNYRKFVSQVLTALDNVDMSDVDSGTEDDEDDSHGKKKTQDFTGMCFMARNSHDVDSSNNADICRKSSKLESEALVKVGRFLKNALNRKRILLSLINYIIKISDFAFGCSNNWR